MAKRIDPNDTRTHWTDSELLSAKFHPAEWIIPNYLPTGLIVLAGRPFSGKSFLSLQTTREVSHGGSMFNQKVKRGKCLYLALEDWNGDLQSRMKTMNWQPTGRVDFFTEWERFKKGGMDRLKKVLESNVYTFCVIDSLYKLLSGSKNERDGEMEPVMTELHNLCKHQVVESLMVNYHSNKLSVTTGEGTESAITGDTSVAGVADSFWLVYKRPGNKQVYFHAEGRKMRKVDAPIQFCDDTCTWRLTTPVDKIKPDSIRGLILEQLGKQPACPTEIAEKISKPASLVAREMNGLYGDGLVERLPRSGIKVFYTLSKDGKEADLGFLNK